METLLDRVDETVSAAFAETVNSGAKILTTQPERMARIITGAEGTKFGELQDALREALDNEIELAKSGHWTFDLNRVIGLKQGLVGTKLPGFEEVWNRYCEKLKQKEK